MTGSETPNRLHTFVAAADGDVARAVELHDADLVQVLDSYGRTAAQQQTGPAPRHYRAAGTDPRRALHDAIDDVMAFRRQGRR